MNMNVISVRKHSHRNITLSFILNCVHEANSNCKCDQCEKQARMCNKLWSSMELSHVKCLLPVCIHRKVVSLNVSADLTTSIILLIKINYN